MNHSILASIVTAIALALPFSTLAANTHFDCTVTSMHAIAEDGSVVTETEHLKKQIGSRFLVEKKSGAIRGGYFINNEHSKEIRVTNSPPDNSYYVVTVSHGPIVMIGYLHIGNHRKGTQKPFTYTSSGEYIYYGYCRDAA